MEPSTTPGLRTLLEFVWSSTREKQAAEEEKRAKDKELAKMEGDKKASDSVPEGKKIRPRRKVNTEDAKPAKKAEPKAE